MFRENLVNKELLVLLATADLLDLWDPLDLLDLLERLEERSELHNNNNKRLQITMSGHQFCITFMGVEAGSTFTIAEITQ